jgi:hypothetical protein
VKYCHGFHGFETKNDYADEAQQQFTRQNSTNVAPLVEEKVPLLYMYIVVIEFDES